jgi:hypothetical protein
MLQNKANIGGYLVTPSTFWILKPSSLKNLRSDEKWH